jgi:hypothetical protein
MLRWIARNDSEIKGFDSSMMYQPPINWTEFPKEFRSVELPGMSFFKACLEQKYHTYIAETEQGYLPKA